ncbi:MAG TPA: hypothetical protein VMC80_00775 [Patescibacteria group bacterium]|nr:hypothetical protein [Patescibacteria group bacterium]
MDRCFKCGVSSDRAELFDAISDEGIVKVCETCAFHEHLRIIKRPQKKTTPPIRPPLSREVSVKMGTNSRSMYDRLSRLSGVKIPEKNDSDIEIARQNKVLREVANRNFQASMMKERGDTSELIDNFNWVILRARRRKGLMHNQLADAIGEPEAALKMVEHGIVPKNTIPFIKKIENYLGIKLLKSEILTEPPKLDLSSPSAFNSKDITIGDLKDVKTEEDDIPYPSDEEENEDELEEEERKETDEENFL